MSSFQFARFSRRSALLALLSSCVGSRSRLAKASSDLERFVRAAKLATYAAQGDDATTVPLLPDSRQLEFRQGEFLYRDAYVGMLRFVGQEIVYVQTHAIWSMSYSGGLVDGIDAARAKGVYAALREALRASPEDLPLRGPPRFESQGFGYACETDGSFDSFHGTERLEQGGQLVFRLDFAGGRLS